MTRKQAVLKKLSTQRSAIRLLQKALLTCHNELTTVEREFFNFRLRMDRLFDVNKIDEWDQDIYQVRVRITKTALSKVFSKEALLKEVAYRLAYELWDKK